MKENDLAFPSESLNTFSYQQKDSTAQTVKSDVRTKNDSDRKCIYLNTELYSIVWYKIKAVSFQSAHMKSFDL